LARVVRVSHPRPGHCVAMPAPHLDEVEGGGATARVGFYRNFAAAITNEDGHSRLQEVKMGGRHLPERVVMLVTAQCVSSAPPESGAGRQGSQIHGSPAGPVGRTVHGRGAHSQVQVDPLAGEDVGDLGRRRRSPRGAVAGPGPGRGSPACRRARRWRRTHRSPNVDQLDRGRSTAASTGTAQPPPLMWRRGFRGGACRWLRLTRQDGQHPQFLRKSLVDSLATSPPPGKISEEKLM
jgi:hypothetical protein